MGHFDHFRVNHLRFEILQNTDRQPFNISLNAIFFDKMPHCASHDKAYTVTEISHDTEIMIIQFRKCKLYPLDGATRYFNAHDMKLLVFFTVCYLDSFFTTTLEYQDFHIIYLISELVFSKHISQSKHRLIKRIRKCVGDPFFLTWYCMTTIKFVPFFRVGIAQSPALANLLAKKYATSCPIEPQVLIIYTSKKCLKTQFKCFKNK